MMNSAHFIFILFIHRIQKALNPKTATVQNGEGTGHTTVLNKNNCYTSKITVMAYVFHIFDVESPSFSPEKTSSGIASRVLTIHLEIGFSLSVFEFYLRSPRED